ncbi:hypothetical protein M885DRAFT_533610 [Pelagophyceae sp. CCMP2097]|nr:hypothetical protein M885DRAFT_533610 [Pelagophyceae sp. CCMP2097]
MRRLFAPAAALCLVQWCAAAPAPPPEHVTSVIVSSCSETCVAIGAGPRCLYACKRQKRKAQAQAVQRAALGVGDGVALDAATRGARHAAAAAACARGGALRIERWAGRLGNSLVQVANCLSVAYAAGGACECAAPIEGDVWRLVNASRVSRLRRGAAPVANAAPAAGAGPVEYADVFWDVAAPEMARPSALRDTVIFALRGGGAFAGGAAAARYDAHVHVRSGDIFSVHDQTHYVPPPLSFYVDVIEAHRRGPRAWRRIKIIAEDDANPVVAALQERYGADFEPSTLDDDIAHVVGARRIIYGQGTFVPALLLFNTRAEETYGINYASVAPYLPSTAAAAVRTVDLQDYFRAMFPWAATRRQRARQLDWPRCHAAAADCEPATAAPRRRCRAQAQRAYCWKMD